MEEYFIKHLLNYAAVPFFFSSATIPVTLSSLEKKKMVDGRLAQFLLPIETIINVPGTAIYIALSAMFIVQTFHPNLLNLTSSILIW
jgi:Na+/H+-dicarboxylate symporter